MPDFSLTLSKKGAREYYMFILNTLCVTYFVTSPVAAFEATIPIKSMHMIKL